MKVKILWLVVFLIIFYGCEKNVTGISETEPKRTETLYYQANSTEPFSYIYKDRDGSFISGTVTIPSGDMYMWQTGIAGVSSGEFSLELHGNTMVGAIYFGRDLMVSSSGSGTVYLYVNLER